MPTDRAFLRLDPSADAAFYATPRLVQHIDDGARAAVTDLYRACFPAGARVLDLMSSWVSHLPSDVAYASVTGLGMNADELAANPRLDAAVVHDLNVEPSLPFADGAFDAAAICVSVQYLTRPVDVLADLRRVLVPGSPVAISFSNRCFPTKAVAAWHLASDAGLVALVEGYLRAAGWHDIASSRRTAGRGDPLYAVTARRPA